MVWFAFVALVVGIAAIGVVIGLLVARRVDRHGDPADDDDADRDREAAAGGGDDIGSGDRNGGGGGSD